MERVTKRQISQIPTVEVRIRTTWSESEQEALKVELKKVGLYGSDFLYTAVSNSGAELARRTGNYRVGQPGAIFANSLKHNLNTGRTEIMDSEDMDVFTYLADVTDSRRPGIVLVYRREMFQAPLASEYRFTDPTKMREALKAIVKIIDY